MSGLLYVYINTAPLSPLTNNTPYIHFLICLQIRRLCFQEINPTYSDWRPNKLKLT